jgi:hypothetical protein
VMTVVSGVGMVLSLVLGTLLGRRIYREISEDAPPEEEKAPPHSASSTVPRLATGQRHRPAVSGFQELPPAGP